MYVAGQSSFASVNISYHCLYVFRDIKHYQNNKDKYIVRIIYHFDQERLKLFAVLGFRVILIRLGFPFFFFFGVSRCNEAERVGVFVCFCVKLNKSRLVQCVRLCRSM